VAARLNTGRISIGGANDTIVRMPAAAPRTYNAGGGAGI
jgi:hypothetical protein